MPMTRHHKHHYKGITDHLKAIGHKGHFPSVNESAQAAPQIHRNGTHVTVIPPRRKQHLF